MSSNNADVYQAVTGRVLAHLRAGTVPWRKPWRKAGTGIGYALPMRVGVGQPYLGVNRQLLAMEALERGYASPWWGTFDQWAERCGMARKANPRTGRPYWVSPDGQKRGVLKGEVSARVVLAKQVYVKEADETTGEITRKRVAMLRFYSVFNAGQCGCVPGRYLPSASEWEPVAEIREPQQVLDNYLARGGPGWHHSPGDRAFYTWGPDIVTMPGRSQFATQEGYYSTAFHEAGHSTGAEHRLAREICDLSQGWRKGDPVYAREELAAEMTAAMLMAASGIETEDSDAQHAAYVASWLQRLEDNPKLFMRAASLASQAADLILDPTALDRAGREDADQPEAA